MLTSFRGMHCALMVLSHKPRSGLHCKQITKKVDVVMKAKNIISPQVHRRTFRFVEGASRNTKKHNEALTRNVPHVKIMIMTVVILMTSCIPEAGLVSISTVSNAVM